MPQDEELSDEHAGEHDHAQHQPAVALAEGHRIMIADHHEQHRQREIGVVHRALLAGETRGRIGIASCTDLGDHPLLPRNDHEKDVGYHDCAEHGTHMHVRRAGAEDMEQHPGQRHHEREHQSGEDVLVAAEYPAQRVIDQPAADDGGDAERDAGQRRDVEHAFVDQVSGSAQPVDDREQPHAGEPRRIGLPLRPVQVGR